jgi:hypothetical protein
MKMKELFISNKEEFDTHSQIAKQIFNIHSNFPKQVFKEGYKNFLFEEFKWTLNEDFWELIKQLADTSCDDFILLAVIDPNPEKYFFHEFGFYNWAKIPIELMKENYYDLLACGPEESSADCILYNSTTIIWTVPSLKWGIWGDRDFEICVLGFNDNFQIDYKIFQKPWMNIDFAVKYWLPITFKEKLVPKKFSDQIINNYLR